MANTPRPTDIQRGQRSAIACHSGIASIDSDLKKNRSSRRHFLCLTASALDAMLSGCSDLAPLNLRGSLTLPLIGACASSASQYDTTAQAIGRTLAWTLRYMDDNGAFNAAALDALVLPARGVQCIIITLQIRSNLASIINGQRDSKLQRFAQQMQTWQNANPSIQLIVRPLHEMNGDWYEWGFKGGHNGNNLAQFNPAWQHVRSVIRREFSAMPFMWCPNVLLDRHDSYAAYYPGDDQLEYLGLDGYNHSTSNGGWETITQVFHNSLTAIRAIPHSDSAKPLVVAETATTEPDAVSAQRGHTKAEWFGKTHGNLEWWLINEARTFGIMAVLYFDYKKSLNGVMNNYLIFDDTLSSGIASRDAFRKAIAPLL